MAPSSTLRWFRRIAIGLAAILVLAFAVGTIGSRTTASDTAGPPAVAPGTATDGLQTSGRGLYADRSRTVTSAQEVAGSGPAATNTPPFGDRIVRTGDLSVEVARGRFDQAWRAAYDIATKFGGQVLSASRGGSQPVAERDRNGLGDITIRVPAARFEAASNALRALGTVKGDQTSSQDVTQEYIDLQARVRNLRGAEAVLLRLFDRAKTIEDTLQIQSRLTEIQQQIEEMTGRLKFLDAQTTFSTITIHIAEPGAAIFNPDPGPSFSKAWATAFEGLQRIASASLIVTVVLSPFALLAAIGYAIWRRARRVSPVAPQA
jgi:hypothetical protein